MFIENKNNAKQKIYGVSAPIKKFMVFLSFVLSAYSGLYAGEVQIFGCSQCPKVMFGIDEIQKSLNHRGDKPLMLPLSDLAKNQRSPLRVVLLTLNDEQSLLKMRRAGAREDSGLQKEGFMIRKTGGKNKTIWVLGKDEAGLMYGGLELAEIIETAGLLSISDVTRNPYLKVRGVKFNIPLDVRTPSYSDVSDAAQENMLEMWNFDFWKEYIDQLAHYRYNYISLWSLHPFPSMVKVPDYPEVALNDVHRSTIQWKENYSLNGIGFDNPEITDNYEVIKRITIDEKISFWQKVMKYGKDRNIQFYVVTWNIFTNGTLGKYGITDKLENPVTRDYFRKSVAQMFLTYPDLAGIGFTTGENMYAYSNDEKEDWAFDTYGKGVLDVLNKQPGRKITLIHRQHQTGAKEITKKFEPLITNPDINFLFSFKYAQAHVYSSVNQVFHQNFEKDIRQAGNLKTLWTLRNDDIFHFRWGAPDFVRNFIKNIPKDITEGYYYGSDQYIWGREFMEYQPELPRQLEIKKHWYQWMLWGRLGYEPEMSNERFIQILQARFPGTEAKKMFESWQNASMIYPITTGFHWGALDFQWYIEACQSRPDPAQTPSGFHDVNRFITLAPHRGTGYMSIPDYVKFRLNNYAASGITPLEVAQQLNDHASHALEWATSFNSNGNRELIKIRDDAMSMASLGMYYSRKIRGAAYLALFRESLKNEYRDSAFHELNNAAFYWRSYASISLSNYKNPLWTNRVGHVDWRKTYGHVIYDITSNGGELNIPSMTSLPGGTLLEAENANYSVSVPNASIPGFTGKGYLETKVGDARHQVNFTYTAPETGLYSLEFRYTLKRNENFDSPLIVNGKEAGEILFWMTGKPGFWVCDTKKVMLNKGVNSISISPEGFVVLDNLNIIKQ